MPVKKTFRKKTMKKRTYRKKSTHRGFKQFARKVISAAGEKKYYPTEIPFQTVDDAGYIYQLSAVPQGDTDLKRDGDQLTLTSLELRYCWTTGPISTAQLYGFARMIVFQWFSSDLADAPTLNEILGVPTTASLQYLMSYNHDHRFQFRVLLDRSFKWTNSDSSQYNNNSISGPYRSFIKKFAKHKIQYLSGTTLGFNNIYILLVSNSLSASAANTKPLFNLEAKLNYTDA